MGFYPLVLDLTARPVVVIGGGPVAERKVEDLLDAEAAVTVVSPALTARLRALAGAGRIRHAGRPYRPGDLAGFALAFAATGDPDVDAAVAREGRRRGVWVNTADQPARCDVLLPAVLRRGRLLVAISTGGASPALARAVREHLAGVLTDDYERLADVVGEVRAELRARGRSPGAGAWRGALADLPALAAGAREEVRRRLIERLTAAPAGTGR